MPVPEVALLPAGKLVEPQAVCMVLQAAQLVNNRELQQSAQ
jgi:hypothetical protein